MTRSIARAFRIAAAAAAPATPTAATPADVRKGSRGAAVPLLCRGYTFRIMFV